MTRRRSTNTYEQINQDITNSARSAAETIVRCAPSPEVAGEIISSSPCLARGIIIPTAFVFLWLFVFKSSCLYFDVVENIILEIVGCFFFGLLNIVTLTLPLTYPAQTYSIVPQTVFCDDGSAMDSNAPILTLIGLFISIFVCFYCGALKFFDAFSSKTIFFFSLWWVTFRLLDRASRNTRVSSAIKSLYEIVYVWLLLNAVGSTYLACSQNGNVSNSDFKYTLFYLPLNLIYEAFWHVLKWRL